MNGFLFHLAFPLAAPFWLLMIVAPTWSWTRRIVSSPYIAVPPVLVYLIAAVPVFGTLFPAVASPKPEVLGPLLATPAGLALAWAHFIAFDLFVGRWIYLDSRDRGMHPVLMAPIMVLTILLGPLGFLAYLLVRVPFRPSPST